MPLSFHFVPAQRVKENSQKIAKIFKKLKITIMATFHAEIVGNSPRKRKNENYHYGFTSSHNRVEKDEKERK